MAGVTMTHSDANLMKGPVHLFVDVAVPAAGAIMTLTADAASGWKTPDAVENPSAIWAGCLNDLKGAGAVEETAEFCDNLSSPIAILPGTTQYSIDVMLKAILSQTLMAKLFGTTTTTISGSTKIQGGSVLKFPQMAIAMVGRMYNDPTKYFYYMFYSTRQTKILAPDQFKINQFAKIPLTFKAERLAGRAEGLDVFEFVHTI
jgi:hypothetical protein